MAPIRLGKLVVLLLTLLAMTGCGRKNPPPSMPPPEVSVIKVTTGPVTVFDEYVAQTQAVDPVEIRPRVGGILERQMFADGAKVKNGELLFIIDQQPYLAALSQAKANLAQARANHFNSQQNLARARPLLADQAISQQDLDATIAKERADAAAVEAAQALVKQASLNLGYTTIRAPRDGVISKALIKRGGLVNASTTLLTTLYSIDPIYVNFAISEQKLLELQNQLKRNPGDLKDNAPPFRLKLVDGSEYKYPGKLNFVDAAVDPRDGTLGVRISVPNPDGLLRSGEFVRVVVPARESPNAIRVPQKAVQELQGKHFVFVVGPDNKVVYRDIVTAARIGNDWLVESGIKPGELVIVEGTSKVRAGMVVKPVMPGPSGPAAGEPGARPSPGVGQQGMK